MSRFHHPSMLLNSAFLFLILLLPACGKKDDGARVRVETSLIRISSAVTSTVGTGALLLEDAEPDFSASAVEIKTSEGIVIDSFKRTVSTISLNSGTQLSGAGASIVYNCPGATNADCLVDLAAPGAVNNLLTSGNSQEIEPRTYTFATVQHCTGGASAGPIYIKARVKYKGNWWYTTAATGVSTPYLKDSGISESGTWVDPADYAAATRPPANGCADYNVFQKPITLEEGSTPEIKLFYELRGLTLLTDKATGTFSSGGDCFAPVGSTTDGTKPYLCAGIPYLAASVEADKPDYQRYLVTQGSGATAFAMVYGFYFKKGTSEPLGAYSYDYYNSTYPYAPQWSSVVKKLSSISSGVLEVVNYTRNGSDDVNTINTNPGGFNTSSFGLVGTIGGTSTVNYTDQAGVAGTVTIQRLDP